jgi:hypothetical protein
MLSCEDNAIVDMDVMSETYVKVMIHREIYKDFKDSLRIKVSEVYEEMGITEENFIQTLESYSYDKEKWDEFNKKAMVYLDSLRVRDNVTKASSLSKQSEVSHK